MSAYTSFRPMCENACGPVLCHACADLFTQRKLAAIRRRLDEAAA